MRNTKLEDKQLHADFVDVMRNRMNWAADVENYEMAARLRDLIEYETSEDPVVKTRHYLKLLQKYSPEFYEAVKHKYENKTINI